MHKFADEVNIEGVPKKTGGAPSGGEGGARGGEGLAAPSSPGKVRRTSVPKSPPLGSTQFVYTLLPFKSSALQVLPFMKETRSMFGTKKY